MKRLLITFSILLLGGQAWADSVSLSVNPTQVIVSPGQTVFISVDISGIGSAAAREVGSFDMFLGFSPSLVTPTGVTFTDLLGDPNLGEALTTSDFGSYWAEAVDVSLLSNAELDSLQPPQFTLATYSFTGIATGTAHFEYLGGPVDDGNGNLIAGTKEFFPVPEPASLALLGSAGIILMWKCGRKVPSRRRI